MRVLGIETSCDETAASVVVDGATICSSVVSSQVSLHAPYGGVVPEVAGREHLQRLGPVVEAALSEACVRTERIEPSEPSARGASRSPVDAVAVTYGPGLVGSLLVGLSTAKGLAMGWGVPLVGVNHLEGHLFAQLLEAPRLAMPCVVLLVSGGHTLLVLVSAPGRYRKLGETLDDAAGEAYDKVARYLGLGYPGGPAIDKISVGGDPTAYNFPRALRDEGYDLSFSGLKTAVVRAVEADPAALTEDVAASFQESVVDVLVAKARRAVAEHGARALCLAGGVAANTRLRRRAQEVAAADGVEAYLPSLSMCTDNAAMVAAAGWWRLAHRGPSPWSLGAEPGLGLPEEA